MGNAEEQKHKNMDEILEVDSFDYEGYQVARGEFFAHLREPGITFSKNKVFVNSACLSKRPDTEYVQILVNPEEKILIIRPCSEEEKDSFRWTNSGKKRTPRHITCNVFFAKVFEMMNWNPENRYRLIGKLIRIDEELMFAFDLKTPSVFLRKGDSGDKHAFSRTPNYPEEWKSQFGVSVQEHVNCLKVNLANGYAIFGLRKNNVSNNTENKENE